MIEYKKLEKSILTGRFEQFNLNLNDIHSNEFKLFLIKHSSGLNYNISIYAFGAFLIQKYKKTEMYALTEAILTGCFPHIKGSYAASYGIVLLKNKLWPSEVDLLTSKLFYFQIPDKIVNGAEARSAAKNLLKIDPNNKVAQLVLKHTTIFENRKYRKFGRRMPAIKKCKKNIKKGNFLLALEQIPLIPNQEIAKLLINISSKKNILAYVFTWALIYENETSKLHILASEVFKIGFYNLIGAIGTIFFHLHRAVELEPNNVEYIERLLNIYESTPESFEPEETKILIAKVLAVNPQSEIALQIQKIILS